jgi:hypothetical protein
MKRLLRLEECFRGTEIAAAPISHSHEKSQFCVRPIERQFHGGMKSVLAKPEIIARILVDDPDRRKKSGKPSQVRQFGSGDLNFRSPRRSHWRIRNAALYPAFCSCAVHLKLGLRERTSVLDVVARHERI